VGADFWYALLLGVIQGVSEYLPVSSTAHLVLAQYALGLDPDAFGLTFDAVVHLGTLLAVATYFYRDFLHLAAAILRPEVRRKDPAAARLAAGIIIGTVPAAVLGWLFESRIESEVRHPALIAATLAGFGVLLWVADLLGRKQAGLETVGPAKALLLGLAQALALVPGVSRSGIVITAGLLLGLRRDDAARFAFLLSAPVIAGAGGKKLLELTRAAAAGYNSWTYALVGLVAAAITGYLAIGFLMRYVRSHNLGAFTVYRLVLAVVTLGFWVRSG
jgi:undecaprenyl-diphosphatase